MKIRRHGRRRAADAGHTQDARSAPGPVAVTWARAQIRERIQREGATLAPSTQPANRQTRQTDHSPLGDMEGRTVTTTGGNLTKDMTPLSAANLLEKLEGGHQAAWLSTREVPWQSAEYQSRFQNAAGLMPSSATSCGKPSKTECGVLANLWRNSLNAQNQRPASLIRARPVLKRLPPRSSVPVLPCCRYAPETARTRSLPGC